MIEPKKIIPVETCQFIIASDLFDGLQDLWNYFAESGPPFSWGDNNRTLVTGEAILNFLDGYVLGNSRVDTLRDRINDLPEGLQTYIDLEN